MSDDNSHRKVYARGYFDALKACGIKTGEMTMNQAKFEANHRGLNVLAKKVFDAVPIAEPWTAVQIFHEMRRLGTGGRDPATINGCINTLIEAGLVEEPTKGNFVRVEVRPKYEQPKEPALTLVKPKEIPMMAVIKDLKTEFNAMDRLGNLSVRAVNMANLLKELAKDIDTAALEIAGQAEKNESETQKMRQLQALLKSLG